MTMTLITMNALLGVALVYGVLRLLVHGIRSDAAGSAEVHALPQHETDRIAA